MNGFDQVIRRRLALVTTQSVWGERINAPRPGQALIMVGLLMMTLIGFAALATDTGFIWMNRRSLQNSVDAAALAGVQALPDDAATATSTGCTYATVKNAVASMFGKSGTCSSKADVQIKTTYFPNDTITVTAYKTIHPIFGAAVGFGDIEISATATALVGGVGSECGPPLFQTVDILQSAGVWGSNGIVLNKPTIMKTSTTNSNSGNFLGLQLPSGSSSGNDFRTALGTPGYCSGANPPQYSGSATTNTGNMNGPLDQGMSDRQAAWTAQGNCTSMYATDYLRSDGNLWKYALGTAGNIQFTPSTCYRMVTIPILDTTLSSINGTKTFNIKGFAMFYIANWCGNLSTPKAQSSSCPLPISITLPDGSTATTLNSGALWGYYVGFVATSTNYTGYGGFGTKVYVLVN